MALPLAERDVPNPIGMKKAPYAAIAEVKPVIAALSLSDWRTSASGERCGSRRATSLRMMTGIIWKVEALPTPVAKKRNMKLAKKPGKLPT